MLVLLIGDILVPLRVADLPPKFRALLVPGKIQTVLCPGDLCVKEVHEYLKSVCSDVHCTRGEFDEQPFPETKVVPIGEFRFGLCHGHQVLPWGDADALAGLARALDVDVLVTGHSLEFSAQRHSGGRVLVNPGSATGAGAGGCGCGGGGGGAAGAAATRPSFVLMDVDGARLVAYIYQLVDDDVKVEKMDWSKKPSAVLH